MIKRLNSKEYKKLSKEFQKEIDEWYNNSIHRLEGFELKIIMSKTVFKSGK